MLQEMGQTDYIDPEGDKGVIMRGYRSQNVMGLISAMGGKPIP
jgi:hypothetical protein